MVTYQGEIAALMVAFCWTISVFAFEFASKNAGTLAVNLVRLFASLCFLSIFLLISKGHLLPNDAGLHQWIWLSLSGIVGFALGDYFLFKAFETIGGRLSMVLMTTAPIFAAIGGIFFLNETISFGQVMAMLLTISGILVAVYARKSENTNQTWSFSGLIFGIIASLGQAGGLLLSKHGMRGYDAFSSTQIRLIAGVLSFLVLSLFLKRFFSSLTKINNKPTLIAIGAGSFFGSFLGVGLSLYSIKYTSTGVASALMAIVPVLTIIPSVFILKQKITWAETFGAVLSVIGVILFFL